jgi:hypothetical protein
LRLDKAFGSCDHFHFPRESDDHHTGIYGSVSIDRMRTLSGNRLCAEELVGIRTGEAWSEYRLLYLSIWVNQCGIPPTVCIRSLLHLVWGLRTFRNPGMWT